MWRHCSSLHHSVVVLVTKQFVRFA